MDRATVNIAKGQRVGLVGRNGIGKTTLFKLILGELVPDSGSLSLPPGMRIGTVAQEAPSGSDSLIDFVLAANKERTELLARAATAIEPNIIAEIHTRLADINAEAAPARAAASQHAGTPFGGASRLARLAAYGRRRGAVPAVATRRWRARFREARRSSSTSPQS